MRTPTDADLAAAAVRLDLHRLITAAGIVTDPLPLSTSPTELYADGARAAQERVGGPLGTAIAGVLAKASYGCVVNGTGGGLLGEHNTLLALAVAAQGAPVQPARPELTERAQRTGLCAQCEQPFAEPACGGSHAAASAIWFGSAQQAQVAELRRQRDAVREARPGAPTQGELDDLAWRLETALDGQPPGLVDVRTVAARLRLGWADDGVPDVDHLVVDDPTDQPATTTHPTTPTAGA